MWRISLTLKSNTINSQHFLQFRHFEPSCKSMWVFFLRHQRPGQLPVILRLILTPYYLSCGMVMGRRTTVVSHSKIMFFRCCIQKMMLECRVLGRHYFARNMQV